MRPPLWLAALILALLLGMIFTLWAGRTGRIRSLHGAEGRRAEPAYGTSTSLYVRVPSPRALAWASWTDQSMWG